MPQNWLLTPAILFSSLESPLCGLRGLRGVCVSPCVRLSLVAICLLSNLFCAARGAGAAPVKCRAGWPPRPGYLREPGHEGFCIRLLFRENNSFTRPVGLFFLRVSVRLDCAPINAEDRNSLNAQFERTVIHAVIYHPSVFLIKTTTEEGGRQSHGGAKPTCAVPANGRTLSQYFYELIARETFYQR